MLSPTPRSLRAFVDLVPPPPDYRLEDVRIDIPTPDTAVFNARLIGPRGSQVWARAWLGTESEGTLAESASPPMNAGDEVTLTVKLTGDVNPEGGYIRIESAPLRAKHIMGIRFA